MKLSNDKALLLSLILLGETYQESRSSWQVWNKVRFIAQKDGEENRNQPTCKIHLFLLWRGADNSILCILCRCDVFTG